jgi:antirestriction protein ArdC
LFIDGFYSTAFYQATFHEFMHSNGHPKRLNRSDVQSSPSNEEYSKEELVAELGAVILCNEAGIKPRWTSRQHTAKAGWPN